MIQFQSVSKKLDNKQVLNQIQFEIEKGKIVFILGKSGVGKSVILKHMVGLMILDEGEIKIDEYVLNPETMKNPTFLFDLRKKCSLIFQNPALFDFLTIEENILFGEAVEKSKTMALWALKQVQLSSEILNLYPHQISTGMQKRVSIARSLCLKPEIFLFDEPTTGLDPIAMKQINQLISKLSKEFQTTSIVVSHDIQCALEIADQILFVQNGKILGKFTPQTIFQAQDPLIKEFIRDYRALD